MSSLHFKIVVAFSTKVDVSERLKYLLTYFILVTYLRTSDSKKEVKSEKEEKWKMEMHVGKQQQQRESAP